MFASFLCIQRVFIVFQPFVYATIQADPYTVMAAVSALFDSCCAACLSCLHISYRER